MDKIKNIDWKQFFLKYGEWIGVTVVALIAFFALYSTTWSAESSSKPTELANKAKSTQNDMEDRNPWPEDKESGKEHGTWEFEPVQIAERASRMVNPVGLSKYEYTRNLTWPLIRPQAKRSPLQLVTPQDVIATPVVEAIAMTLDEESDDEEKTEESDDKKDAEEDAEFRIRKGDRSRKRKDTGPGGLLGGGGGSADDGGGSSDDGGSSRGSLLGGGDGGSGSSIDGGTGAGAGPGGPAAEFAAEGHRFVAVRSVIDISRQKEYLADALHLPLSDPLVQSLLEYIDFNIERQTAVPGPNPWGDKWEKIDYKVAADIQNRVAGNDYEIVDSQVVDEALVQPLPPRLVEEWGDEASHPRIKDFKLSDSQKERQRKSQELFKKVYEEYLIKKKNQKKKTQRAQKGGWARSHDNKKDKEKELKENDKEAYEKYLAELKKMGFDDVNEENAAGNLLLFRYLDFTVEPGKTYRYRVQVILANPHFGVPADELEDHAMGERPTLETDFSKPSAPVTVPQDYDYFVHSTTKDSAEVNMFYWYYKTGTKTAADEEINKKPLKVRIGNFIGGEEKAYIARTEKESFNKEKILFESKDVLLAVSRQPRLKKDVFPELALGRSPDPIGARMTVANLETGEITTVGSTRVANKKLGKLRRYMAALDRVYEDEGWKDRDGGSRRGRKWKQKTNNGGYPGGGGGGYGDGGYPGGGSGSGGYPGGGSGSGGYPGGGSGRGRRR